MNKCKPWESYNVQMQKMINEEINEEGVYERYLQEVVNKNYSRALELNQEIQRKVSKIYSESEGIKKEQAKLRLELLEKIAKDIQLSISSPNHNRGAK